MSNQSLRKRFKLTEEQAESASRIIREVGWSSSITRKPPQSAMLAMCLSGPEVYLGAEPRNRPKKFNYRLIQGFLFRRKPTMSLSQATIEEDSNSTPIRLQFPPIRPRPVVVGYFWLIAAYSRLILFQALWLVNAGQIGAVRP
jgi:hypothetical protein